MVKEFFYGQTNMGVYYARKLKFTGSDMEILVTGKDEDNNGKEAHAAVLLPTTHAACFHAKARNVKAAIRKTLKAYEAYIMKELEA